MKTGCYFTFPDALAGIGITVGTPKQTAGPCVMYRALAPTWPMLKMSRPRYGALFQDILGRLDPRRTWDEVHRLAGDREPILLCYEQAPFHDANWCHRRLVAQWFLDELGEEVPEADGPTGGGGLVDVTGQPMTRTR